MEGAGAAESTASDAFDGKKCWILCLHCLLLFLLLVRAYQRVREERNRDSHTNGGNPRKRLDGCVLLTAVYYLVQITVGSLVVGC